MAEIARLSKDCHGLAVRLAEEEIARSEVELRLQAAEDRCVMIEQEVREECWADMDEQMEQERKRWQTAWDEQVNRFFPIGTFAMHAFTNSILLRLAATMTTLTRRSSLSHAASTSTKIPSSQ
jgi:hypothetical protein